LTLVLLGWAVRAGSGWKRSPSIAQLQQQIEERDHERTKAGLLEMAANRSTRDQSQFLMD